MPGSVLIEKRLTIDGDAHTVTASKGISSGHLFIVTGANSDVTIQNITLDGSYMSNGKAEHVAKGFSVSEGALLTLGEDVTICNFTVGVDVEDGAKLFINGASIERNEYGIRCFDSELVMNSGSIYNNTVIPGETEAALGCGVIIANGTFTMNGGSITNNKATGVGGGVLLANRFTSIMESTFTMNGGVISNNSAGGGGGICALDLLDFKARATLNLNGGTITGSTVQAWGGGIYLGKISVINWGNDEFAGTVITGNSAPENPGIHNEGGTLNNPNGNVDS